MNELLKKQLSLFFTGGAVGSLLYYSVYYGLIEITREQYLFSGIVARVLNSAFNFYVQRKWVFGAKEYTQEQVLHFLFLSILLLFTNTLFLFIFVEFVGLNPKIPPLFIWIPQSYIAFTFGRRIFTPTR